MKQNQNPLQDHQNADGLALVHLLQKSTAEANNPSISPEEASRNFQTGLLELLTFDD